MIKICTCCGKEFETDNYAKKCCSQECATKMTKANMKEKECEICHQKFIPKSGVSKICDRNHYFACEICGKSFIMTKSMYHDKVTTCSRKCSKEKTKRRNQEIYGCDHPMQNKEVQERFKQSMMEKYGVEHALQSDKIKNKTIQSNREKFGVDWALGSQAIHDQIRKTMEEKYGGATTFQSDELTQKYLATMLERYGVENPMQNEELCAKMQHTVSERYGVENVAQNEEIHKLMNATRLANNESYWTPEMQEKSKQTSMLNFGVDNPSKSSAIKQKIKETMIEKYGVEYGTLLSTANKHRLSKINQEFGQFITEQTGFSVNYEFPLGGKLYDIRIEGTNILVEIDPTYTHNLKGNHWTDKGLDKNYHKNKSEVAKEFGYRCIHVFDWDDINKIVDLIRPKQVIHARECSIFKLNSAVADEFLDRYHLQGTVKGQILRLGLVKDCELFQVMTFGRPRYDKKHSVELLRLCTKAGYAVVGGAEKLFKFAVNDLCVRDIISYCDLSKFSGDVYQRLGMKLLRITEPQEVWSKGSQRITANLLRQRGFDQLFGTNFGKGASNEELMLAAGWLPVCDCGQAVYVSQ